MPNADLTPDLQAQVQEAAAHGQALRLCGADTKSFYGREIQGERLSLTGHRGIVSYEPTELVLTARCGTPVDEIESLLGESGQMLSFEPPQFPTEDTPGGTLGGAIASGLGGPRRPWGGAPRDLVLGIKLLDGNGQVMRFGGQVMKNVAGYDISRLMTGALGTLGVLLEISIKVLPRPPIERTLVLEKERDAAVSLMRDYANKPAPLSGACHLDDRLYLRLTGNQAGVDEWAGRIGGEQADNTFWIDLRDQRLDFFQEPRPLWRLSLPPATPRLLCEQFVITDWAGAQRWVHTEDPAEQIRNQVAVHGGHATLFRHGDRSGDVFHPLDPVRQRLHRGLKQTFDPKGILNPGRLYADL
jgi:glycolate oxidase FAD binding subunit